MAAHIISFLRKRPDGSAPEEDIQAAWALTEEIRIHQALLHLLERGDIRAHRLPGAPEGAPRVDDYKFAAVKPAR